MDQGSKPFSGRKLRILVAEDNPVNQQIAVATLEAAGYQADAVSDGVEAVEAAQSGDYDAILMDIRMPRMDGVEAAREIRALPGDAGLVPIIALTADAQAGDRQAFFEAGMNGYAFKPFKQDQLVEAIEEFVQGAGDPAVAQTALDNLRDLEDRTSDGFFSDVIELFLDTSPLDMAALFDAIDARDAAAVESLAHKLKSSCANVGAIRLAELLGDVLEMAQAGDVDGVTAQRDMISAESDQTYRELGEML